MQLPTHSLTNQAPTPYPLFILFGDSITQFSEPHLLPPLRDAYTRKADLLNRGFSGYTSLMALHILPHFFPTALSAGPVRLMTVFFGANDACLPGFAQHVPLHTYVSCLEQILRHDVVLAQGTKVVLVTPGPVDEWGLIPSDPNNPSSPLSRSARNTARYAEACKELGTRLGIPVVDLWTAFMAAACWEGKGSWKELPGSKNCAKNEVLGKLLPDGLHFSAAAYDIMREELLKVIEEAYPGEMPDRLPSVFPTWDQVLER